MSEKINLLITGGCGFIGSNLVLKLAENATNEITVIDNLWRGTDKYIKHLPNVNIIIGDLFYFPTIK